MSYQLGLSILIFAAAVSFAKIKHVCFIHRKLRICVFCGSRPGFSPEYLQKAKQLGQALAKRDIELVYGGGSVGLMGEVARAVHDSGGTVYSVIPRALVSYSGPIIQPEHCIVTGGMHERKRKFVELADAFLALPGGCGTLEELSETATWIMLGVHNKPFGVLNIRNFWGPLRTQLQSCIDEGFMGTEWIDGGLIFESDVEKLLDTMLNKLQSQEESKAQIASHDWVI